MTEYVAFLRGINVGGRIIKMTALKKCFEELGCEEVVTHLQSGNVVFQSAKPQAKLQAMLEAGLTKTFKYPAKVQVIAMAKLRELIDAYPFGDASPDEHDYVIFMEAGLEKTLAAEATQLGPDERIKRGDGVVYWRVSKGNTLKSTFAKYLVKPAYKVYNTNRNLRTLRRIVGE